MSWNIAKPGDQINGPVSITGALTSSSTISGTQIISTVATGTAPLTVASTTNVTNLNADLLDGQQGSYYQSADNINAGTLVVGRGGTGASTFTAGRVLFGNGTSALNTSANLFWDNANNRLGIGTATPRFTLDATGDIAIPLNSKVYAYYGTATNYASFGANNSGNIEFTTGTSSPAVRQTIAADGVCTWSNVGGNNGTAMTLNATGLGVGMSPSAILSAQKSSATQATGLILRNPNGTNGSSISLDFEASSGTSGTEGALAARISGRREGAGTTGALDFFTNANGTLGTAKMVLDSSGNLGLGVTPSAWSLGKAFEISSLGAGFWSYGNDNFYVNTNAYFNGGWKYAASSKLATSYQQYQGTHQWYTAASGTVGNAISDFASAKMTLDASGNLLVGTASTGGKVHVRATDDQVLATGAVTGYTRFKAQIDSGAAVVLGAYQNSFGFIGTSTNHYLEIRTNDTERIRIKSTGQVNFVGLASDPAGAAAGDVYYNTTTNKLKCYNGTTWNDLF